MFFDRDIPERIGFILTGGEQPVRVAGAQEVDEAGRKEKVAPVYLLLKLPFEHDKKFIKVVGMKIISPGLIKKKIRDIILSVKNGKIRKSQCGIHHQSPAGIWSVSVCLHYIPG